jgi:hypothetical protein
MAIFKKKDGGNKATSKSTKTPLPKSLSKKNTAAASSTSVKKKNNVVSNPNFKSKRKDNTDMFRAIGRQLNKDNPNLKTPNRPDQKDPFMYGKNAASQSSRIMSEMEDNQNSVETATRLNPYKTKAIPGSKKREIIGDRDIREENRKKVLTQFNKKPNKATSKVTKPVAKSKAVVQPKPVVKSKPVIKPKPVSKAKPKVKPTYDQQRRAE